MAESLNYSFDLPVYPERVYRAWLDGAEHRPITGRKARIDATVGGAFLLLDGQVSGSFTTLTPHDRIVQTWQMDGQEQPGQVELVLEPTCTGTELKLRQTGIAPGKTREMIEWWEKTYFRHMKAHFEGIVGDYVADMGDG